MEGYQAHLLVGGRVVCHPVLAWEEEWGWGDGRQERQMPLMWLYPDGLGVILERECLSHSSLSWLEPSPVWAVCRGR